MTGVVRGAAEVVLGMRDGVAEVGREVRVGLGLGGVGVAAALVVSGGVVGAGGGVLIDSDDDTGVLAGDALGDVEPLHADPTPTRRTTPRTGTIR